MKRRNGFVFIETIIVITILVTALLLIYASFTSVLTSEKERIKYDDIAYIYRTMYLTQFLEENNVQILYDEVDKNNFTSFDCGYSGLIESGENGDSVRDFCEGLKTSLEVSHLYMTRYDITPYKRCKSDKSNAGLCGDLVDVEEDMLSYIHSLRIFGDDFNGYRIIASYQGKSDESNCYKSEDGDCLVYNNPTVFYSSLKPANKSRDYDYFKVNIDVINGYTLLSQGKVNVAANRSIDVKIYPNDNYSVNSFAGIQCTNGQYGYIDNGKLKVQHVTADTTCTVSLTEDNSNLWNFSQCGKTIEFSAPNTGFYKLTTYGATGGIGSRYRYDNDPNNANSGLKCHKDINFERDNGIAEGVFKFDEKDKLYVYVGCPGGESIYVNGNPDSSDNTCFSFQTEAGAGGWNGGAQGKGIGAGGTGGATHIALSDNLYYDDLLLDNENLLLVAHGGSSFINDKDGKSKSDPSTKSKISDKVFNGTGNISDENVQSSGLAIIEYLEPVYTVTIRATNGKIDDKTEISYDVSKTYLSTPPQVTAIANTGYHYYSFSCLNGQTAVSYNENTGTVTIDSANITSDTTCTVNYAINTYTVTFKSNNPSYGTVKEPNVLVTHGNDGSTTINAKAGYHYDSLSCVGGSVSGTKLTVSNVTSDITCTVNFKINTYTIKFNVTNGTKPNNVSINYGGSKSFVIPSNVGYSYKSSSCNNGAAISRSGNNYTVSGIPNSLANGSTITCTIKYTDQTPPTVASSIDIYKAYLGPRTAQITIHANGISDSGSGIKKIQFKVNNDWYDAPEDSMNEFVIGLNENNKTGIFTLTEIRSIDNAGNISDSYLVHREFSALRIYIWQLYTYMRTSNNNNIIGSIPEDDITYWVNTLIAPDIASGIMASNEAQGYWNSIGGTAYAERLYHGILGRDSSASERSTLASNGLSNAANILATSTEAKDIYDFWGFRTNNTSSCPYKAGQFWQFGYTGSVQSFTVPTGCPGTYKLEVWGAQGGSYNGDWDTQASGGKGGYSQGQVSLSAGNVLYVVVGGEGDPSIKHSASVAPGSDSAYPSHKVNGGYNGGGGAYYCSSNGFYNGGSGGGGATHIATRTGLLSELELYKSSVLIVAGGGGGTGCGFYNTYICSNGGAGGGTNGNAGANLVMDGETAYGGSGGTANSGYKFGLGDTQNNSNLFSSGYAFSGGGGGGYYGGTANGGSLTNSGAQYTSGGGGGGGGSGYIGGVKSGTGSMQSGIQSGNGFAKITLISLNTS